MGKINDIWYAVVNPNAGSGKTLAQWREAESLLFKKHIKYKFVIPESVTDSSRHIKAACRAGHRKFIAVGGDGTVHHLLETLVEYVEDQEEIPSKDAISISDFTLVVLPIGSGNDWLRSHNIPNDHSKIVDLIASDSFSPQDIVRAEILDPFDNTKVLKTSYMANIGGYCFDANVCDVVNFQKANGVTGKLLYINALRSLAFAQKPARTKIVCDGGVVFNDFLYSVSFGNGMFSGGGLCQTPSAVMDDGILDIMIAPVFPIWKVFFNIKKVLDKKTEEIPFLHFHKARRVELYPVGGEQGQLVEMDGDIIGRAPLRLSFMKNRINVLHIKADGQDATNP